MKLLLEARGDHFFDLDLVKDHAHPRVDSVAYHLVSLHCCGNPAVLGAKGAVRFVPASLIFSNKPDCVSHCQISRRLVTQQHSVAEQHAVTQQHSVAQQHSVT